MRNYLLWSTIIGIFTEILYIHLGIDFKIIYLIFFVNYIILLTITKLVVPKFYIYIILYLIVSGTIGCLLNTDSFVLVIQQIIGIAISMLYFYNLFFYLGFKTSYIFEKYLNVVYYLSIIGIIIFIYNMLIGNYDYRLQSLMSEPAHYAGITVPAFYYYLKNYNKNKLKFYSITLSLLLSVSSVAYICIFLSIVIYNRKVLVLKNIVIYTLGILLAFIAYSTIENFKFRVDDTLNSYESLDVSGTNWSTYALISNLFVTENVLSHSPIVGNGIGSHEISHAKYINNLIGNEGFELWHDINSSDANSLLLRILSDLGILGFVLVVMYIYKFYTDDGNLYIFSRAIFIYFFYKLFREGHYFSPEMYFFVFLYYFNYKNFLQEKKAINNSIAIE